MHCDQCEMVSINGVPCHETGCPNARKTWMPDRQAWVRFVECFECGCDVEEGESCDCQDDPPESGNCDPLYGERMDSADMGEFDHDAMHGSDFDRDH